MSIQKNWVGTAAAGHDKVQNKYDLDRKYKFSMTWKQHKWYHFEYNAAFYKDNKAVGMEWRQSSFEIGPILSNGFGLHLVGI